ncbi:MAG TPA: glycosyltransferase [Mycobacteriales bacterium]|nr:glycosyltransferase [Mycobacteriales bacterium]
MTPPAPPFRHLRRLTDGGGLYEHAERTSVRPEHGYCLDDAARALVVLCREPDPDGAHDDLRELYLTFVLAAEDGAGRFRNRLDRERSWQGTPSVEDCWGRALWGLGATVASTAEPARRDAALATFERGARWRSPWSRAMAFAALGAADVLRALPAHREARALLTAAALQISAPAQVPGWPWPEARLSYANAVVPEVLLAAGATLDDPSLLAAGLRLLDWLLEVQTRNGHLSVVPVGGRGPADGAPGFDQQPIEVAALADACARAYALTGQQRWADAVQLAAAWFLGANDSGTALYDPDSGGGCDGLEQHGRNENQGAESTLALISTLRQARSVSLCPR